MSLPDPDASNVNLDPQPWVRITTVICQLDNNGRNIDNNVLFYNSIQIQLKLSLPTDLRGVSYILTKSLRIRNKEIKEKNMCVHSFEKYQRINMISQKLNDEPHDEPKLSY